MPEIPYIATNFAGNLAQLNGPGALNISWAQLVWAAVTCGKAYGDEFAFGAFSAMERLNRATLVWAYLYETGTGMFERSLPYLNADPSEKRAISFYLGMTLSKLVADLLLGVPRALHFAVYGANYQVAATPGASRPDLIGEGPTGDWVVLEAKGSSNGFANQMLVAAKIQAQTITTINGATPVCRVATESYFAQNALRLRIDDPEYNERFPSRQLTVDQERFARAYYRPLDQLIQSRIGLHELNDATRSRGAYIPELDFSISIHRRSKKTDESMTVAAGQYLGRDGVLIRLGQSWTTDKMQLQPFER